MAYKHQPKAKVAIFTDFGDNPNNGLLAAASVKNPHGYLYKQDDADVIASCIRDLHAGTQLVVVSPGISEAVRQLIMPRVGAQAVWAWLPRGELVAEFLATLAR